MDEGRGDAALFRGPGRTAAALAPRPSRQGCRTAAAAPMSDVWTHTHSSHGRPRSSRSSSRSSTHSLRRRPSSPHGRDGRGDAAVSSWTAADGRGRGRGRTAADGATDGRGTADAAAARPRGAADGRGAVRGRRGRTAHAARCAAVPGGRGEDVDLPVIGTPQILRFGPPKSCVTWRSAPPRRMSSSPARPPAAAMPWPS